MKRPSGKGGRKHLEPDEAELWDHTARTIEPLKRAKPRVHAADDRDEPQVPRTRAKAEPPPADTKKRTAPAPVPQTRPVPAKPQAPPIAEFDRKKVRKIRSGQVEIEARIDLHGMRQSEAHGALVAFLLRCQRKGQRWVLVITGKGKAADHDADAPFEMTFSHDRGVLKRNVPRWLEEPDVRPLVVSYTTAAIQHGGEGALYVHLRTKR